MILAAPLQSNLKKVCFQPAEGRGREDLEVKAEWGRKVVPKSGASNIFGATCRELTVYT